MTEAKWTFSKLLGRAEVTDEAENVVHLHRPSLEAIEHNIRMAQLDIRNIIKEGKALEDRFNEAQTREANGQAALIERLSDLGLKLVIESEDRH